MPGAHCSNCGYLNTREHPPRECPNCLQLLTPGTPPGQYLPMDAQDHADAFARVMREPPSGR